MRQPDGYEAGAIKNWSVDFKSNRGTWEPARPEPSNCIYPWTWRFKMAWNVLIGNADALFWAVDQPSNKT